MLFFVSGMLQAFMVPLQSTFALVTAPALHGRVYSLAGAVSVACAGGSFPAAGWLGQHHDPQVGVAASAGICLALIAASVLSWPHRRMQAAVVQAYTDSPEPYRLNRSRSRSTRPRAVTATWHRELSRKRHQGMPPG